jgi:HD superfamily phosphodiesterase
MHVQAVAAEAERLARQLSIDPGRLESAAWLHDVGYAPPLHDTGFHPLDGARYLRAAGWLADVCALVAHHTCARVEAYERGLADQLTAEFTDHRDATRDALWTADATTGPGGEHLNLDQRVEEIEQRYGEDHLVARCMRVIRPELVAAIERTRARTNGLAAYPM